MVECHQEYWPFVLETRNKLREYFLNPSIITDEDHKKFMEKNHQDYFICLSKEGVPLGWVGVVDNDVRIAVDPSSQKNGVGKFMLQLIKKKYPYATAQILKTNTASLNLFNSAGINFSVIEKNE